MSTPLSDTCEAIDAGMSEGGAFHHPGKKKPYKSLKNNIV